MRHVMLRRIALLRCAKAAAFARTLVEFRANPCALALRRRLIVTCALRYRQSHESPTALARDGGSETRAALRFTGW